LYEGGQRYQHSIRVLRPPGDRLERQPNVRLPPTTVCLECSSDSRDPQGRAPRGQGERGGDPECVLRRRPDDRLPFSGVSPTGTRPTASTLPQTEGAAVPMQARISGLWAKVLQVHFCLPSDTRKGAEACVGFAPLLFGVP
jgi:hypothetical protein